MHSLTIHAAFFLAQTIQRVDNMFMPSSKKRLLLQEYEHYISSVLDILQKKLELLISARREISRLRLAELDKPNEHSN